MNYELINSRIINLCNKKGVTKTKALIESGAGKDFTVTIKNGSEPSMTKFQVLADYFNTTTDYLLGNTNNPSPPDDKEINDNDIKFALFGGDEGITDEMFEDVKKYAEYIKSKKNNKS